MAQSVYILTFGPQLVPLFGGDVEILGHKSFLLEQCSFAAEV